MNPSLHISKLSLGYESLSLFDDLNLSYRQSGLIALMGRNGIGKTTLIRCLAGLKSPNQGQVLINQENLGQLSARRRARMVSLVLTHQSDSGWMTVEEMVRLGRNPYTNWWGKFSSEDHHRVQQALSLTGLQDLRDRPLHELSDGQLQKALLARALTQDSDLVILDEPLVHLDPPNKWEIMNLLHKTAHQQDKILIMATHEIELSINHSDYIWLAHQGGIQAGLPEDLMLTEAFNKVFDNHNYRFQSWQPAFDSSTLPLEGDPDLIPWTSRALIRHGIEQYVHPGTRIVAKQQKEKPWWTLYKGDKSIPCTSIEMLIENLKNA